jgi:hypothetical protein
MPRDGLPKVVASVQTEAVSESELIIEKSTFSVKTTNLAIYITQV